MHRFVALFFFAALSDFALSAQPSCEITDFGILAPLRLEGIREAPTTATGRVREFADIAFQQRTDRIPLRLGTRFGVAHTFRNVPPDGQLWAVVTHPPITNANGQSSSVSSAEKNPTDTGTSYGFDSPSELLPGTWVFEFRYRSELLCRKAFTVVSP